jgi:hypothetical protein
MDKYCEVCKQSYPEDLAACPHCAARRARSSDSEIELTLPENAAGGPGGSEPPSGTGGGSSAGQPAAPAAAGADRPPSVDSVLDMGLVPAESSVDLGASPARHPASDSGTSDVDWAALVDEAPPEAGSQPGSPDQDVLLPAEGVPAEVIEAVGAAPRPGEAAGLASDQEMVRDQFAGGSEAPSSGSGIDLAEEVGDEPAAHVPPDSVVNLDDALDLEEPARRGESPSGRDRIAEAVESGVDLPSAAAEIIEAEPPSGGGDVVGIENAGEEPVSSAVDLGAIVKETSSQALADEVHEAARAAPEGGDDEAIDLEGLPEEPDQAAAGGEATAVAADEEVQFGEETVALGEAPGVADEVALEPAAGAAGGEGELVGAPAGPAPAREPAGRGGRGAWLGGTGLGLVLGAGSALGLWLFGVEPPASWRLAGGPPPAKQGPQVPLMDNRPAGPGPAAHTKEEWAELLRRGDVEKAAAAGIEQAQEANAEEMLQRGDFRWMSYLKKQTSAGAPLKADDEPVKQAVADLQKAGNNPDALFLLGQIQELTNQTAAAEKTYARGAEQFKDNPAQKRLFETALDRLRLREVAGAAGAAWLPAGAGRDPAALAALLVVALQQPQQPVPNPNQNPAAPAAAEADEAGFDFWLAMKQARAGNYAEALKSLDKARSLHDRRRFTHLRKAQNPLSDPTEEIFLRSCDELRAYWKVQEELKKAGYLEGAARKDPAKAVDALVKKAADATADAALLTAAADKLTQAKVIDKTADLAKGVDQLLTERKQAEAKAADLAKMLKQSKGEAEDLSVRLKTAAKEIEESNTKLKEAAEIAAKLKADLAAEGAALQRVADDLAAAKYLDGKAGKAGIPQALKEALRMAAEVDPEGLLRQLRKQVARDEAELKERWRPEEMLTFWLPILEQDRRRKDLAAKAALDADRVLRDESATPADRARAELIRGLALRNEDKFGEAREALERAKEGLRGDRNPWLTQAETALKEVSDPAGWYVRQAEALHERGQSAEALTFLNRAIEGLPAREQLALVARRSLLELELARANARGGAVPPGDPMLAAARKDAELAALAGLAEGHYAAGRVAEESGQNDAAADSYRKALAAHPALDAAGGRYRVALARVLVQPREAAPPAAAPPEPAPAPKAGGEKTTRLDALPGLPRPEGLDFLALLAALTLQAPALPPADPARDEADKLADEVLKAPADAVPFDVRAQALAVKGRWTLALITYVDGLRRLLPPEYAAGLAELVRNHPRLRRPDGTGTVNPLEASKHYAAGLNFYFDGDYGSAERAFAEAVDNDPNDARYYYFLGLSRLALGKPEGREDLDQGGALEQQGRPPSPVISAALERVQGRLRRVVNEARDRAK